MAARETVDESVALSSQALADALEQQAATTEILRVISRSPADAQPVFDTIAAAALKLCAARSANVFTYDGSLLHIAALAIVDARGIDAMRSIFPRPASDDSAACRAVLTCTVVVEALKQRKFNGDFDQMLAWWRLNKEAQYLALEARAPTAEARSAALRRR